MRRGGDESQRRRHPAADIEAGKTQRAHGLFHVVAENPKKNHVAEQMKNVGMQKQIAAERQIKAGSESD